MEEKKINSIYVQFFQVIDPWKLLLNALYYALGAAVGYYLGVGITWSIYISGQVVLIGLHIASMYLVEYFSRISNPQLLIRERRMRASRQKILIASNILQIAISFLTIAAVFCFLLISQKTIHLFQGLILLVIFLLLFFLAVPPLKFLQRGAGELIEAMVIADLIPVFSFSLHTSETPQILATITLPLSCLCLAAFMAVTLPEYGKIKSIARTTMMERVGWQAGMIIHNILILAAYILMLLALFLGQPWRITWPGLLTLPVAIMQLLQLIAISRGAKPRWGILKLTSYSLPVLSVYLFLFTLWII